MQKIFVFLRGVLTTDSVNILSTGARRCIDSAFLALEELVFVPLDWRRRQAGQFCLMSLCSEKQVSALILASSPSGAHKKGEGRFINRNFCRFDLI